MKRRRHNCCSTLPQCHVSGSSLRNCALSPSSEHCRRCCSISPSTKKLPSIIDIAPFRSFVQPTCPDCLTATTMSDASSCISPFSHHYFSDADKEDDSFSQHPKRLFSDSKNSSPVASQCCNTHRSSVADSEKVEISSPSQHFAVRKKTLSYNYFLLTAAMLAVLVPAALAVVSSPPRMLKQSPPELFFQPHIDGNSQRSVVLECEAEGEPQPSYYWLRNNRPFDVAQYENEGIKQQPGRGSLEIARPRLQHEGVYQCFAQNEHGVSVSNRVLLKHAYLDSFPAASLIPTEIAVTQGEPHSLSCTPPGGDPKPNVFWMLQDPSGNLKGINSSRIAVSPDGGLHFSNITYDDATNGYLYACAVHSTFLQEYKVGNFMRLYVKDSPSDSTRRNQYQRPPSRPPQLRAPMRQYVTGNVNGLRSNTIELHCIYGGTPVPEVEWFKDNGPIAGKHGTINYGKTLRLHQLDYSDKGTYECRVSNGQGKGSASMNVNVEAAPYFTRKPDSAVRGNQESVTFYCDAGGDPQPSIQWYINGTRLEDAPRNPRRRTPDKNTVIIDRLQQDVDTDNYQCNASNKYGYAFADAYINVISLPPKIVTAPAKIVEVVDGDDALLTCRVFGAPQPRVEWRSDGKAVRGARYQHIYNGDLQVQGAIFADAGEYTCFAENDFGTAEASGTIKVYTKPFFNTKPENLMRKAGEPATFRCQVVSDSNLPVQVKWLRDGYEIDFRENPRFFVSHDNALIISQTKEADSGNYTCVAQNKLKDITASAALTVRDVPPAPIVTDVICQAERLSAVIRWQPGRRTEEEAAVARDELPINYYSIYYNTSFEPDNIKPIAGGERISANANEYQVALSPWVNYTFRVVATNEIGPSQPSKPFIGRGVCSTPPMAPSSHPQAEGRGNKPDNMVITWPKTHEEDQNAPDYKYQLTYWPVEDEREAERIRQGRGPSQPPPPTAQTVVLRPDETDFVVKNLPTYQPYAIQVKAVNELGEPSVQPKTVIGFSGEDKPLDKPKQLRVYPESDLNGDGKPDPIIREAIVEWQPVDKQKMRGNFRGYRLRAWDPDTPRERAREQIVGPDQTRTKIDILKPDKKNFVDVVALNNAYESDPSDTIEVQTEEGTPGIPNSLAAYPMGPTALYVQWREPEEPNGKITGYQVEYAPAGNASSPLSSQGNQRGLTPAQAAAAAAAAGGAALLGKRVLFKNITDPQTRAVKLTGLDPNTKYRIWISANTQRGRGDENFLEKETEPEDLSGSQAAALMPPGKPDFNLRAMDNTTLLAEWIPSGERLGEYFYVQYKEEGEPNWRRTDDVMYDMHTVLENLKPATYAVRVVSVAGANQTPSDKKTIDLRDPEAQVIISGEEPLLDQWWFWLMLGIILLLLLALCCTACCLACRRRGGKYAVNKKVSTRQHTIITQQQQPSSSAPPELQPFTAYPGAGETESLGTYNEEDIMEDDPNKFGEDASFIGQYGVSHDSKRASDVLYAGGGGDQGSDVGTPLVAEAGGGEISLLPSGRYYTQPPLPVLPPYAHQQAGVGGGGEPAKLVHKKEVVIVTKTKRKL